jgi:hypothetical protein
MKSFYDASPAEIASFAGGARVQVFAEGESIYRQNDASEVFLFSWSDNISGNIAFSYLLPGDTFTIYRLTNFRRIATLCDLITADW